MLKKRPTPIDDAKRRCKRATSIKDANWKWRTGRRLRGCRTTVVQPHKLK